MKRFATVVAVLTVLACFAIVWNDRRPHAVLVLEPRYAFDVCVSEKAVPLRTAWSDPVLSAVVRALDENERKALATALAESATRWEARANPMLDDLEGGDPDTGLVAWFKAAPMFVHTAETASRVRACSVDGLCVTPTDSSCPVGFRKPADAKEGDRARFLLWPWGHALRFRASSADAARTAAATLRALVRTSKRIAVVMSADDVTVTKAEPFAKMRDDWHRVAGLRALVRKETDILKLQRFDGHVENDREIIILPRLAAISDDATFSAEVLAAAPGLAPAL